MVFCRMWDSILSLEQFIQASEKSKDNEVPLSGLYPDPQCREIGFWLGTGWVNALFIK